MQNSQEVEVQSQQTESESIVSNPRWQSLDHQIYIIFALETISTEPSKQISFVTPRRSYIRYDRDLAHELLKNYPTLSESSRNMMLENLAKRAKSKFNTLKRMFFKGKKKVPDFPLYIYMIGKKMVGLGQAKNKERLMKGLAKWEEYYHEHKFVVNSSAPEMKMNFEEYLKNHQDSQIKE